MKDFEKIGGGIQDAETVEMGQKEFANLTRDVGFKIVFGTEGQSENLLMTLLNRLLGLKIVSLKYLPTERLGLTEEESKSLFDVYCKDSNGRRFLIEMQMWTQPYFHKRAVYYSSLSVQDQGRIEKQRQKERGRKWDYYFAPVYQVSFLNFPNTIVESKEDGDNPYISHYVYRSKDTGRELGDDTNIVFVDLHKFRKDFEECSDLCEKWLYSIRNMHLLKESPAGIKGTELEELYTEAHYAAWSAEKRKRYEELIMDRHDYDVVLQHSYDMGIQAGIEKGREEGREEGRTEGRSDAARKMLASGMQKEQVAAILQLSTSELDELLAS